MTALDAGSRAYYEMRFQLTFMELEGDAFQEFFCEIMAKRYPGDFQRVRPWGAEGDHKNDGYHRSQRTIFQVYAPERMERDRANKKITEDFNGCVPYWEDHFDHWRFVHNSRKGLPAPIASHLLAANKDSQHISVAPWSFDELRNIFFELSAEDIAAILGPAITPATMLDVGYAELQTVLSVITQQTPSLEIDLRPVPADKIAANGLSDAASDLLKTGMVRADLVRRFFAEWHDATLGDRIAEGFKAQYAALKTEWGTPDEIFTGLWAFAGGRARGTAAEEAAVLAVLAHLFEECVIFERVRTG